MFTEGDRFPVISSLLDEIDFRDNKLKDDSKLILLSEEILNVFNKSNAAAQICQAFEGGLRHRVVQQGQKLPDDFLSNVCKSLKFSAGQCVSLAICLSNSLVRSFVTEANRTLKQKLPEMVSSNNLSDMNEDILIAVILFVQNSEELSASDISGIFMSVVQTYSFSSAVKTSMLNFSRGIMKDSYEKDIFSVQNLSDASRQRLNVSLILEEVGAQSSGSIELFRKTLQNIGVKLDEEQIASIIITVLPRPCLSNESEKEGASHWNLEVVAEVLNQDCRGLNWVTVVKCLDSPNLIIRCEADYQLLTRLFVRISGASMPVLGLLAAVWSNRPAYLAILTLSANSPRNIVDFSTLVSPEQLMSTEVPAPANLSWLCLPLYARFFDLAASGMPNEVLDILSKAAGSFPEYFLTSLAQVQDPTSGVRSELLRRLLPSFTGLQGSRPTSLSVMRKLFTANPDLLILLCRFALKKAKKVWEISNIDGLLKSLGPQIVRRLEDEGTIDEMLGYWCVKADRSELNLEDKAMILLDTNPKNARVFVSFAKIHADSLRPRILNSDGILSFECFAILLRAVQAFPTIVSIDEVRALATIFSQHQQNLHMQQHSFPSQISSHVQQIGIVSGLDGGSTFNDAIINPHQAVFGDGNSELARLPSGPDSEEIEALANSYFQKIYSSEIVINDVVVLLRQFKSSTEKREQEIFRCMIHNLFDEYRFFHKYPEKELQVTGRLFGALIQNQLVSSITLGIALRYVLEALRKDPELGEGNDKMFRFGRVALDQFRSRLGEWPQYCSHLIQIPHFARHSSDLFHEAQKALNNPQQQQQQLSTHLSGPLSNDLHQLQSQGSAVNMVMPQLFNIQRQITPFINHTFDSQLSSQPFAGGQNVSVSDVDTEQMEQKSVVLFNTSKYASSIESSPSLVTTTEVVKGEDNGSTFIDLMPGNRVNEIVRMGVINVDVLNTNMPPESVRDQIHFIINNIAKNNIEAKTNEIREILKPEHFNWFANYLVVKRISTQPNLHPLYLSVLDALDLGSLVKLVLDSAYHNVTKLLQSPNITTSSSERSLLRNLGVWLGQMTLAKNRPLLQKRINLKELLFWGFETGRLIAVCSFVAKIVEGVKESRVFRPPNPWLMAILGIMRELYEIDDLKLNIKFEVQVLCKNINIKIEDIPKGTELVRCRGPVKDQRNPDFNTKTSNITPSLSSPSPVVAHLQPSPKVPSLQGSLLSPVTLTQQSLDDSITKSFNLSELLHTTLQNLASSVVVNSSLQFFVANPTHRRLVVAAVDRGVREIIQSAVERSVTIAITSTKCLVVKDFATEPDERNVRKGAHFMASSLAGSLALATSKEPLRISISNHLRTLLTQVISDQSLIEQIVQVCSNDNVDMGAALVEKVAIEKAVRDVDDLLVTAYQSRKKFRDIGQQFVDTTATQASGKYPTELSEVLKPSFGGLTSSQMQVYEAFQRVNFSSSQPSEQSPSVTDGKKMLSPPSSTAQLSISQGLEAYQHVLVRIDSSLKNVQSQAQGREVTVSMLGSDHDIPHLLRDISIVTLRIQVSQRGETAMTFAEIVFNKLFDSISSPDALRLEVLVSVLETLREACGGVGQFSPDFIAWLGKYAVLVNNDEISRKMYRLILILLLRVKLLKSADVDIYFVMYIDSGRNLFWLELALSFIRQCLVEGLSSIYEFSNTFDTVTKMRPSNMVLKKQLQKWLADIKTLTTAQEEQKNSASNNSSVNVNTVNGTNATIVPVAGSTRDMAIREHVTVLLDRWLRVWNSVNDQIFGQYLQLMHQYGVLKTEEAADRFFRIATEICTEVCLKSLSQNTVGDQQSASLNYTVIDALSKLFLLLVRLADKEASDMNVRVNLLSRILNAIARSVLDDHEAKKLVKIVFDQRPYFRLFSNLSHDLGVAETKVDPSPSIFGLLTAYTQVYLALSPTAVPGFAYGWVQLISRRSFMPHLLLAKGQKGWPYMHRLLSALLLFLQPFLKSTQLIEPVKKLYKGTLRVLLVLLHDFPEFLCDFHLSLCDLIPLNCVQLRNLILSAFPRSMRLPDPFTPNLKVDVLTEISQSPRILTDYLAPINGIRSHLDSYMSSKTPVELPSKLPSILTSATGIYNMSLITSLVVYIGSVAIQQVQVGKIALQNDSPAMDIFRHLVSGALDAEGRYIVLNTMTNQLRYPNSHTNFFSFVLLNLFLDAEERESEFLQEQITRVLLERLIVHRPHPWGLLITFIELIKNPRYSFWKKSFTRGAPEIEKVFESIARSCIGPNAASLIQQQIEEFNP